MDYTFKTYRDYVEACYLTDEREIEVTLDADGIWVKTFYNGDLMGSRGLDVEDLAEFGEFL